jgi:hypothetical protein
MTRTLTMYDAVNVDALPHHTAIALGYVDGRDTSGHFAAMHRRFPGALVIPTTVTGEHLDAKVGDVERGDMTPEHGAQWAHRKVSAGEAPTLYCSASNWPTVRAEVAALKFPPGPPVSYLVALYDGVAKIPRGAIGKQYSTGSFDTSIVSADWPGVIPTALSGRQRRRARRLVSHLSKRYTPMTALGQLELTRIIEQAHRIERL